MCCVGNRCHKRAKDVRFSKEWLEDDKTQENLRNLARWLLIVPLILVLIFGCGSLALLESRPAFADTRSQLWADYSQWPFMVIQPINPEIVEEIKRDRERYEDPAPDEPEPVIVPGPFWSTPTPTATPEATPTISMPTNTATETPTPINTPTDTPTKTPTETSTETPTVTETPTPSGPPPPNG